MKHTPGPWTVSARHGKRPATIVLDANKNEVCEVYAAADLIAAAPELLSALQGLLQGIIRHEIKEEYLKHYPEVAAARAAIRAATGEEKP